MATGNTSTAFGLLLGVAMAGCAGGEPSSEIILDDGRWDNAFDGRISEEVALSGNLDLGRFAYFRKDKDGDYFEAPMVALEPDWGGCFEVNVRVDDGVEPKPPEAAAVRMLAFYQLDGQDELTLLDPSGDISYLIRDLDVEDYIFVNDGVDPIPYMQSASLYRFTDEDLVAEEMIGTKRAKFEWAVGSDALASGSVIVPSHRVARWYLYPMVFLSTEKTEEDGSQVTYLSWPSEELAVPVVLEAHQRATCGTE